MKFLLPLCLLVIAAAELGAQTPEAIIPVPSEYTLTGGTYRFKEEPSVKVVRSAMSCPEAYSMKITRNGVKIKASDHIFSVFCMGIAFHDGPQPHPERAQIGFIDLMLPLVPVIHLSSLLPFLSALHSCNLPSSKKKRKEKKRKEKKRKEK